TEKLRLSSALAPALQPPLLLARPQRSQMRLVRRRDGMGAQRTEVLTPRFSSREPMVHPSLSGRDSAQAVGENDVDRHLRRFDIGRRIGAADYHNSDRGRVAEDCRSCTSGLVIFQLAG